MVADSEELKKFDASEIHARRLSAKEVFMPKNGDHFIFPIADGTVKLSGRDAGVRKSTLTRFQKIFVVRGETQRSLNGKLTWPITERKRLSKHCVRLRRRLRRRIGKSEIGTILLKRSIKNLGLSDFD